jgi:biopolymer transport protein ExbB
MDVLLLFRQGGLVMYPLLLCSVLVLAVAFERFFVFRRKLRKKNEFKNSLLGELSAKNWEGARTVCANSQNILARVLGVGLEYYKRPENMREALEEQTSLESSRLREHLNYLDVVVTMAPLLGLLGTVLGIIHSFSNIDFSGGNSAAIASGIGEALISTAAGLCVAVLALSVHTYFAHLLDYALTDIEDICIYALSRARSEER